MLKQLSQFMSEIHSPYLMYLLFVVAGGFFWLFNFSDLPLPISNPQLVKIGGGEGLLDLKFFYTAQEAYAILTQYGEAGRAYLRAVGAAAGDFTGIEPGNKSCRLGSAQHQATP